MLKVFSPPKQTEQDCQCQGAVISSAASEQALSELKDHLGLIGLG